MISISILVYKTTLDIVLSVSRTQLNAGTGLFINGATTLTSLMKVKVKMKKVKVKIKEMKVKKVTVKTKSEKEAS